MQYHVARVLARLPDGVKIRLSGEPAIVVDGQRLDPQVQLIRSAQRKRNLPGLIEPTVEAGRRRYRRAASLFCGPVTEVGLVRDFQIPGAAGPLDVRHYRPRDHAARPLTVYLHGGGFCIGDLDTHDEPCRILCREARSHVLSVAYRLAPEHPFPAALDDARAALAWARANAGEFDADARRVALAGDSAGANLSAVLSALEPRANGPAAQLLIYPPTDASTRMPSHDLFGEGFFLDLKDTRAFFHTYVDKSVPRDDPRLSPLRAPQLAAVPPTLVAIAGFDVLRDEGEAYAQALLQAGATARVQRFPSLPHGFIHLTGVCPAAQSAMIAIARGWRALLESQ